MNPQCIIVIPLPSINKVHSRRSLLNTNQSVPWLKVIVFAFLGKRPGFPVMHRLFFTVAEQRWNYIKLPCKAYARWGLCCQISDFYNIIMFEIKIKLNTFLQLWLRLLATALLVLYLLLVFIVTVESIIILPICQIFFIRISLFLWNIIVYHMQFFRLYCVKKLKKQPPRNMICTQFSGHRLKIE